MGIDNPPRQAGNEDEERDNKIRYSVSGLRHLAVDDPKLHERLASFPWAELQEHLQSGQISLSTAHEIDAVLFYNRLPIDEAQERYETAVLNGLLAYVKSRTGYDQDTLAALSLVEDIASQLRYSPDRFESFNAPYQKIWKIVANASFSEDFIAKAAQKSRHGFLELIVQTNNAENLATMRKYLESRLDADGISGLGYYGISRSLTELNKLTEAVIGEYIQKKFNLSYEGIFKPYWTKERSSHDHLKTMLAVEEVVPGGVQLLNEKFNILFFARYPSELLIRQAEEYEADVPYGLVLFPHDDYNDAFYAPQGQTSMATILSEFGASLGENHSVRIAECDTKRDLGRLLLSLHKRYGQKHKIAFGFWGGHGSPDSIQLGKETVQQKDVRSGSARKLREFFEDTAPIALLSCSTGTEDGIAQELSEVFGKRVTAPSVDTNITHLGAHYDEHGVIHLDITYSKEGADRKFSSGRAERSPDEE